MTSIIGAVAAPLRSRLQGLLERPATQRTIIALIPINAALLGLETWRTSMRAAGDLIGTLDRALLAAIPGLGSIALVLLILYYVFAAAYPDWFGHIGRSLYTLVQIMTLESWSMGIARPVMAQFPYAWLFFVVFILVATFTMLNLFIAIIVNAMQRYSDGDAAAQGEDGVRDELRALRAQIERLSASLAAQGGREGVSR